MRTILPPIKNKKLLPKPILVPLPPIIPRNSFEIEINPHKLINNERYTFYKNGNIIRGTFVCYLSENGIFGLRIKIDNYSVNNQVKTNNISTPLNFIQKITKYKIGPNIDTENYINQFI
jgi:hypothetical protein